MEITEWARRERARFLRDLAAAGDGFGKQRRGAVNEGGESQAHALFDQAAPRRLMFAGSIRTRLLAGEGIARSEGEGGA